jgi:hypothetical protein
MANRAKTAPHSAEERQAIATVHSTREVYGEIEQLAEILKENWRPLPERIEAKYALAQSSERLCNLMALAIHQLDNAPETPLRDRLRQDLEDLKNKLMGLGARLMVEKLEKIDKRAEEVLQERDYPLGLSGKLDIAFANLMSNLKVLGGADRLGEDVPGLVSKTEGNLNSLNEIEKKLGIMVEMPQSKSHRP